MRVERFFRETSIYRTIECGVECACSTLLACVGQMKYDVEWISNCILVSSVYPRNENEKRSKQSLGLS